MDAGGFGSVVNDFTARPPQTAVWLGDKSTGSGLGKDGGLC